MAVSWTRGLIAGTTALALPLLALGSSGGAAGAARQGLPSGQPQATSTIRSGAYTFRNFEPAGLNTFGIDEGGGAVGTKCPGAGAKCYNTAAEPAIRADGDGNFYASSENGLGAGTEAWKSTDGGRHYVTLPSPDAGSSTNDSGFAPGGGDTDLAIADDKSQGQRVYNVYVSSLTLADVDVSTSIHGGRSWMLNPVGAVLGGADDREWIAADDASEKSGAPPTPTDGQKVCVSYHDAAENINVDCSYTAGVPVSGTAFTQHASAIDVQHAFLIDSNEIGNLAIAHDVYEGDHPRGNHNVYQVFSGPRNVNGTTACGGFTCLNVVWIAVSRDGGKTFTDHIVHAAKNKNVSYGHQFVNVSVDRKGNIYVVYTDDHNMFYSYSRDRGSSWHGPYRINSAPANTAIFPWSTAGDAGKIDVVYYGTPYYNPNKTPDSYPNKAHWKVYFAQNTHVFRHPRGFTQVVATPLVHRGGVCESGVACTGNRDLYDDFGVAASPTTGKASIVYSSDQFHANDPRSPNPPSCTVATTNTSSCDHTAFATQTAGPGIF